MTRHHVQSLPHFACQTTIATQSIRRKPCGQQIVKPAYSCLKIKNQNYTQLASLRSQLAAAKFLRKLSAINRRDIKAHIHNLADSKQLLPVWILDEAQNLPPEFFRDFPAFLNFAFDSRDLISVWLVGHPSLAHTLERAPYAALAGRIQARVQLKPVQERERFAELIQHGLKHAGCTHTLLADSGMEILRQASKGLPRHAGRILRTAMRLAVPRALNHLPDELLQLAIEELR